MSSNYILLIVLLLTISLILICHFSFSHSKTKNPGFLRIGALCAIVYFLAGRGFFDLHTLITFHYPNNDHVNHDFFGSLYWSKVLLLDLCPFLSVFLGVSILCNKNLRFARLLALMGIFSSAVTLVGEIMNNNIEQITILYIFLGTGSNRLYILMHFNLLILSIVVILNNPYKFSGFNFCQTLLLIGGYLLYVGVMKTALNINGFVTGLSANDGNLGQYVPAKLFVFFEFPHLYGIVILYFMISCVIIISLHNTIHYFGRKQNGFLNQFYVEIQKNNQNFGQELNGKNCFFQGQINQKTYGKLVVDYLQKPSKKPKNNLE